MAGFSNRMATVTDVWRTDRASGLRKEGHNTGREGNGAETGGNWYLVEGACILRIGCTRDKERCGSCVGVVPSV